MAENGSTHFNNIYLAMRSGLNPGQLKVHPRGLIWRRSGGGKIVEVDRNDVGGVTWTRVPKGWQLAIKQKAGSKIKLSGFRDDDLKVMNPYLKNTFGRDALEKTLSISGRNWGEADIEGNMLSFNVGGKQSFEVNLADVSQATVQGKNEVQLEVHVDDTAGEHEKDTLLELSFYIPPTHPLYVGDERKPSAQVFYERVMERADVGSTTGEIVVTFNDIAVLTPRGRYSLDLTMSSLRMQGQANDFKIQYSSIVRQFVLPKPNLPHTMVVITLDPPIRKGQTFYPHLVLQFSSDQQQEVSLKIDQQSLETKYKDVLEPAYKGTVFENFARILKGLSGAKITRPGQFKSHSDQPAVKCSYKAEEGFLYPLEKQFFFVHKPPILITHDEIEYVEFERQNAVTTIGSNIRTFDLAIHLKSETEHQFRNIQKTEYSTLFHFISAKKLKIANLKDTGGTTGLAAAAMDLDDEAVDPHMARIRNQREGVGGTSGAADEDDSDEEDEDFVARGGSGSEEGSGDDSEGGSDGSDQEDEKPAKKEKEKKPKAAAPAPKRKKEKEEKDEKGGKKKRKKKDPNAPKRALSGYMYFTMKERERVKRDNPNLSFPEIGKALGEKWKSMSEVERAPYFEQAKADQERYKGEMEGYKKGAAKEAEGGSDADQAEDGDSD